jgi:hypothetical protein
VRGSLLGMLAVGLMIAARPSAGAEVFASCAPAHTNLDKLICAHSDLIVSGGEIADRVEQLHRRYRGEDRRVFDVEYKRWRYELNYCAGDSWHKGGEHGCVRDDFDARLKLLADLASGSKDIQEVSASYSRVEPWYVNELPKQYEGRAVYIDAYIYLRGCDKPGMAHSALLGFPRKFLRHDTRPVPLHHENRVDRNAFRSNRILCAGSHLREKHRRSDRYRDARSREALYLCAGAFLITMASPAPAVLRPRGA